MKICIPANFIFGNELLYIWDVLAKNKNISYEMVEDKTYADLLIDDSPGSELPIAVEFYKALSKNIFSHQQHFQNDCLIRTADGRIDHLATAFYMINSFQEYHVQQFDELERFRYADSYQCKYKNIHENLVQNCFDKVVEQCPQLSRYKKQGLPSKVFLSHDIDSIHGALMQDGLVAIKQGKFGVLFKLLANAVMSRPDWLNMDKIMKIESEYDFRSTFFWIVSKGKVNERSVNADYDIQSPAIQNSIKQIGDNGSSNGLHKSISPDTLKIEIEKSGFNPVSNRYHYLKFNLPQAWDDIENAKLQLDASLGFAEMHGFRNSYGLPFQPYNFETRKSYSFIEAPLNVMDGTFQRYMKLPVKETAKSVITFFEKNEQNCLHSVLWHNTFFTDHKYAGYLGEYKKILDYLYERKFQCLTDRQIINEYLKADQSG
ncbi:MAG: hypothetical protein EPN85_01585 [Bacteroidetes bacterium]|nr:MAG: hypothetical protein EPN85_01585 [Bacteroidota bacterium]